MLGVVFVEKLQFDGVSEKICSNTLKKNAIDGEIFRFSGR